MKTPDIKVNTIPNRMGIFGWLYGGKYGIERYLFTLHRVTGLGILVYLMMHIGVTWFKNDPVIWNKLMSILENPMIRLGEFCVFFGVIFHAMNGIRLIICEFGFKLGKPERPVYPYTNAMSRQRPFMIGLMILTAIIIIYGAAEMFLLR